MIIMTDNLNESSNELDSLTRHRMTSNESEPLNKELRNSLIQSLFLGGILGFLAGIIAASFLHKYIVHPLGW